MPLLNTRMTTPLCMYDCTGHYAHSSVYLASRCTGKERDVESGNDYFEARYYGSAIGRFMPPDWSAKEEPVPYATSRQCW